MQTKFFSSAVFFIVSFASYSSIAQQTIQDQFKDFNDNQTSTWEEYQMIKKPGLNNFWKIVTDTVNTQKRKIEERGQKILTLNTQIDTLNSKITNLELALAESEALNSQLYFLGMNVNKAVYNVIVWAIIFGLVFMIGTLYLMFIRSNAVTQKTQKAYSTLEREFDAHKEKARENQAKIKRELQTALNTLQENRINH